jgi:tRNA (guanine37-N1)-methyltransferase
MMKLKEILTDILDDQALKLMVNSYDLLGDILILDLPAELEPYEQKIGKRILDYFPRVKIIARKKSRHQGEYRTRELTVITGEKREKAVHKENGITLHLNPWQVYYSVRSGNERFRIAKNVKKKEHVAVLGSGVAPYPLVIAKHSSAQKISGIEINPVAHAYGLRNVHINKFEHRIELYQGDAGTVLMKLNEKFDRVVSILPTHHTKLLLPALNALHRGGTLHHYAMVHQQKSQTIQSEIEKACTAVGHTINNISIKKCGHCGVQTDRCCFTVQV